MEFFDKSCSNAGKYNRRSSLEGWCFGLYGIRYVHILPYSVIRAITDWRFYSSTMLNVKIRDIKRWFRHRYNRVRANYSLKKDKGGVRAVIPDRHRKKVTYIKYLLTAIGLLSAFYIFASVFVAFVFGLLIFVISTMLERVAFRHPYLFIHPLPNFDLDNDKWVGCGFGYAVPPDSTLQIPLVSMMIDDLEYAKKLSSLFLAWTSGKHSDKDRNIQVSVVVLNPNEYIFFFYPNPKRPIARRFFQSARDKLRQISLTDEVGEGHVTLVLGKRCHVGLESYFPEFRQRYRSGVPVMFEFVLPPYNNPKSTPEIKPFVLFDLQIKDKSELTRKDFVYEMVGDYKTGGKWQGPEHLNPDHQQEK